MSFLVTRQAPMALHVAPAGAVEPRRVAETALSAPRVDGSAVARRLSGAVQLVAPPHIDQEHPDGAPPGFDGSASCGPACLTMLARAAGLGRGRTDAQMILDLGVVGRTTLADGTETEGIVDMATAFGRKSYVSHGADVAFTRQMLQQGRVVISNGEYYAMAPHADPTQSEGHFVLVYGIDARGRFLVRDPSDALVSAVSAPELGHFLASHERGGVQIAIDIAPSLSKKEAAELSLFRAA